MTYYHYTQKANIPSILQTKVLKDDGWGVFVCNSKEDILKFVFFYVQCKEIQKKNTIILEFKSNSKFQEVMTMTQSIF